MLGAGWTNLSPISETPPTIFSINDSAEIAAARQKPARIKAFSGSFSIAVRRLLVKICRSTGTKIAAPIPRRTD